MARPLPAPTSLRSGFNGATNGRPAAAGSLHPSHHDNSVAAPTLAPEELQELERLREENAQLRALCLELEQALHEATQNASLHGEERTKEFEALLDEKTEIIRQLHEKIQELQGAAADMEPAAEARPGPSGPAPREDELLSLSEELERERRQLQEDEQALMQQMREMEVSMAKERAEMARQRNDMQRLQGEIQHELERLERCGALQSKIDGLKSKLQDTVTRRGSAPAASSSQGHASSPASGAPSSGKNSSLLGRLFGGK
ncbi:MAG TPA: hypothetical protein VMS17_09610 [Gemmataceae bacterium]|nr:hypothetical protein [Gemmataceae bacterium]